MSKVIKLSDSDFSLVLAVLECSETWIDDEDLDHLSLFEEPSTEVARLRHYIQTAGRIADEVGCDCDEYL